MNIKKLAVAAAAALTLPAFAAIAPGGQASGVNAPYNGNGELFMVVFDGEAKVSYAFDMGVQMGPGGAATTGFFFDAQKAEGFSRSWAVNDANWTSFLGQVSVSRLQWAVLAFDTLGPLNVGGTRLFTTIRDGDESRMPELVNGQFTNAIGSSQAGTFFAAVNTTGTHGVSGQAPSFAANGSSVNLESDSGNAYFGEGRIGLSNTLNGNATFSNSNAIGTASSFFYLTRSGSDQLASILIDPFNNAAGRGSFNFNATGAGDAYELSYALAPIPEPGTLAMLLAGGAVLAGVARRNRRQD